MIRCEVIIYWSKEDQAFIAEVPELPGCMADGPTYQQALAHAEVVIQEWIDTAKELGRPIPEPKGRLTVSSLEARKAACGRRQGINSRMQRKPMMSS